MAKNGNLTLIEVDTVVIASQRNATFEESRDTIDISDKTSSDTKLLSGRYSASATCSSLYVDGAGAWATMVASHRAGTEVDLVRQDDSAAPGTIADVETCKAFITSMSTSFPDQGPAEAEVSFQINGDWT